MDQLIEAGAGGIANRAELAREAIEAMVLELRHGIMEDTFSSIDTTGGAEIHGEATARQSRKIFSLKETALSKPGPVNFFMEPYENSENLVQGLHNRDYPSLWAAHRICHLTQQGPVAFDEIVDQILPEAWDLGEKLLGVDKVSKQSAKLSALFPTNHQKKKSAETGFVNFAIGYITKGNDGQTKVQGHLFDWKVIGIRENQGVFEIGITRIGHQLLDSLAGITVEQPHNQDLASRFFEHLAEHSPSDWGGFMKMMESASKRHNRKEIITAFSDQWPQLTEAKANSNAANYIARGREWGLVEMKLVDGRYDLTEFGELALAKANKR